MDNVSGSMKSLCEDIAVTHADRKRSIKDLREQAETIRSDARRFVDRCKKLHRQMREDLKKNLSENRKELIKNVYSLREDFRKKEKGIRADLAEASKIWNNMNKTLRGKELKSAKSRR